MPTNELLVWIALVSEALCRQPNTRHDVPAVRELSRLRQACGLPTFLALWRIVTGLLPRSTEPSCSR
jgi:hypothetical protein